MFAGLYKDKTVWLSGHTGFKGAWMAAWLRRLGARVHGYAIDVPTQPALFDQLGLAAQLEHEVGDVRDFATVRASILRVQPDFIFHFAAQTVVRASYTEPVDTYTTNVMGTIAVLEAARALTKPCAAVVVTTDKCYENREIAHAYTEDDALGGHDPYSSSKAAAEIAASSWRRSFFGNSPVRIATARAGNVIGGGDWTKDQLVPDCMRALARGAAIEVRNPAATRPWQHVLEPLSGYLWLGAVLARPDVAGLAPADVSSAFNFGPNPEANQPVRVLVDEVLKHWPGSWIDRSNPNALHEAGLLMISSEKAKRLLKWSPTWTLETAVARTVEFYRELHEGKSAAVALCARHLEAYEKTAAAAGIRWATA